MAACKDFPQTSLAVEQGQTWSQTLRWETKPEVFRAIQAITKSGPVRITAAGHDIPDGWRVAVEGVKGMVEINAARTPPRASDYHVATWISSSAIEINDINTAAVDGGRDLYGDYVSGGVLRYFAPVDLTDYTFEMVVLDRPGGNVLASNRLADAPLNIITIVADNATKTIHMSMAVDAVGALPWTRGVYDVCAKHTPTGVVTKLLEGSISVSRD